MPNKISQNYYPVSQKFFQDLLSKFSLLLSLLYPVGKRTPHLLDGSVPYLSLSAPISLQFSSILGTKRLGALEEVAEIVLEQFFHTLRIIAHSILFLIIDDTLSQKSGKKVPGCSWYKDHAQNRDHAQKAYVFGHQWVLLALLYEDFLLPFWANLYHPKGTKGCGRFQTKITMAKGINTEPILSPNTNFLPKDRAYRG